MMKTKTGEKILCALFCITLALFPLLYLLLPEKDFSENEKRFLSHAPELTTASLMSGAFSEQAENWAADHMPARDFFVGLDAYYTLYSGRQATKEIYRGKSGRLYEAPVPFHEKAIRRNMAAVNDFAETTGRQIDLMLVPSAGYILQEDIPYPKDPYQDDRIAETAENACGSALRFLSLFDLFEDSPAAESLYFRTDHHWTSRGAWTAAQYYLREKGRTLPEAQDWTIKEIPGFCGTTWSRSALWGTPPETLELWSSGTEFSVFNRDHPDTEHEGLFYPEHLEESDKYPVFLDGNHSLVRIRNASPSASGRLLVIRDSFANCLGCFLAEAYEETVLIDLRYYRLPVSELLKEESFDDILILYSINNFAEDANIVRLE